MLLVDRARHTHEEPVHEVARAVGFETERAETPSSRKLCDFNTHVSDLQRVRDTLQLYSDSMEAMLAAQVVLGDALDIPFVHTGFVFSRSSRAGCVFSDSSVTSNGAAVRNRWRKQ